MNQDSKITDKEGTAAVQH